jgi:predicted RNase H-like HicB family nuclease
MSSFIGVVHKEPDSDYGVCFPDFPGCITAGSTIDEAKDLAQESLALHMDGMVEDGQDIPEPSRLEEIMKNPDFSDGVAFLVVSAPDAKPKTLRINISIPENTLRLIDSAAREQGLSRSAFLVRAASREAGDSRTEGK